MAFGLVYGVLARQAGLSLWATTAMSVLVFAGAAQFTAVSMWGQASAGLIIATAAWLPGKGNLVLAILAGGAIGAVLEAWWTPTA